MYRRKIICQLAHSTRVSSMPLPRPKTHKKKVPLPTMKPQQEPPQSPLLFKTEVDQEEFEGPPIKPGYALDLHLKTPTKVDVVNVDDHEMEEEEDVVANFPLAQDFHETPEEEDIVEGQESLESQEEQHQQVAASYRYVLAIKCLCIAMVLLRKRLQPISEIFYTELYRKYL